MCGACPWSKWGSDGMVCGLKRNAAGADVRNCAANVKKEGADCASTVADLIMRGPELWLIGVAAGVLALFWGGCADRTPGIPPPTPDMATGLGVGLPELERGRTHYLQHCAHCHPRVAPGTTDPEFWREITPRMASYAQLTESRGTRIADLCDGRPWRGSWGQFAALIAGPG